MEICVNVSMTLVKTNLKFSRNVWALGWTSFFTDISTEIIYPLLPVFLTTTREPQMRSSE